MALLNIVMSWSLIPSNYVQEAVKNIETYAKDKLGKCWKILKTAVNPLPIWYEPTEDVTPERDLELASYYQLIIGVFRWMVELGRIDTNMYILMLDSHLGFEGGTFGSGLPCFLVPLGK